MRYLNKGGEQDLNKIIHYCELEKKILRDLKKAYNQNPLMLY